MRDCARIVLDSHLGGVEQAHITVYILARFSAFNCSFSKFRRAVYISSRSDVGDRHTNTKYQLE